jgi:hypothetical protein
MAKKKYGDNDFVVYLFLDEEGVPFYVGKGRPDRPYKNTGRKCKTPPREQILVLYEGLDEKTAFEIEIELIEKYGRKSVDPENGTLENLTRGGEGISGHTPTKEHLEKLREINRGENNHGYVRRNWCSVDHGLVLGKSCSEVIEIFPEENLAHACLSRIALGQADYYRGWIYIDDSLINKSMSEEELKGVFSSQYALNFIAKKKEENLENIRNSLKSMPPLNYVPRNWSHEVRGFVPNKSCSDLAKEYPEDNLWRSCLTLLAKGKIKQYKGWVFIDEFLIDKGLTDLELAERFSAEYAKDLAKKARVEAKNNREKRDSSTITYKYRNWCHVEHGFVSNKSLTCLIRGYPGEKLDSGSLSRLVSGGSKHHKGWVYIPDELIDGDLSQEELKKKFSKEYAKGIVESSRQKKLKNLSRVQATKSKD